jgi:hypothetical protein
MGQIKNVYRFLVGKAKEKKSLVKPQADGRTY